MNQTTTSAIIKWLSSMAWWQSFLIIGAIIVLGLVVVFLIVLKRRPDLLKKDIDSLETLKSNPEIAEPTEPIEEPLDIVHTSNHPCAKYTEELGKVYKEVERVMPGEQEDYLDYLRQIVNKIRLAGYAGKKLSLDFTNTQYVNEKVESACLEIALDVHKKDDLNLVFVFSDKLKGLGDKINTMTGEKSSVRVKIA